MRPEDDWRFERKSIAFGIDASEALFAVKNHPFLFREIFAARQVNSIYFDSHDLRAYRENIAGVASRRKIRIRWYGSLTGQILHPVLEVKIKNNILGTKNHTSLGEFSFPSEHLAQKLKDLVKESDADPEVREYFGYLKPVIICSYLRRYFISADRQYRLTLDSDLKYTQLNSNASMGRTTVDRRIVFEVKYSRDAEPSGLQVFSTLR